VEHGRVIRPWIGVAIDEVTPAKAEALDLPVTAGVIIVEIISGGPAQRGGLQVGDIIISLGEGQVVDFESLRRAIFAYKPGDTVDVVAVREGREVTLQVTLGELPQAGN
jgi:serine protease Do